MMSLDTVLPPPLFAHRGGGPNLYMQCPRRDFQTYMTAHEV